MKKIQTEREAEHAASGKTIEDGTKQQLDEILFVSMGMKAHLSEHDPFHFL